jgi:hypothetical protein
MKKKFVKPMKSVVIVPITVTNKEWESWQTEVMVNKEYEEWADKHKPTEQELDRMADEYERRQVD